MKSLISIAALVLAACSGLEPRQPIIEVRMTATAFGRDSSGRAAVPFDVINRGGAAAYFVGCPDPMSMDVDRQVGGAWQPYLQPNVWCLAIYTTQQAALVPGATLRSSFIWDLPGTYRLRVHYRSTPADANELLSRYAASFTIR